MQIFINETSLHGQFLDNHSLIESVKKFLSCIRVINELKKEKSIFKSDHFYFYTGITGTLLESSLKSNQSIYKAFIENLQFANPKSWQKEQVHDVNSNYTYSNSEYVTTSVAEIAERKLLSTQLTGFLLNFSESCFGTSITIEVVKNATQKINIDCNVEADAIYEWFITNGFIKPEEQYNENSSLSPRDIQTVLRDTTIFEKTNYPNNNGRKVYRKKGTNQLWVVDSSPKHAGAKSHIEIFDENTKKHLGTSLYNEINLNSEFKVDKREINLG